MGNTQLAPEHSQAAAEEKRDVRDHEEISLLDLLILLVQRKGLILNVTVACVVISIVLTFVLPARYTATVLLLPPQQNTSLGAQLASQMGGALGGMAALAVGGSAGFLKNPNDMIVSLLKSRTVGDAMLDHYGLMKEYHMKYRSQARTVWENHSSVDGSGKDGLIRISVWDSNPHRAAELANGYVDEFRELSENLAITEAGQRRLFFQQQMEHAKNDLANAETALTETEQKTGLIQLDSQARALIESAASLRAQITAKEVQIQGIKTYATGENAQLVQAQQELDGLRTQLARLGGDQDIPGGSILPPKGQMTAQGVEYVRRLRDVKYYETIFDILARQFEIAKLDEAKEGALIQVVDPAVPPDLRSFPKRRYFALAGLGGGFVLGIVLALLLSGLERMKQNSEANIKLAYLRRILSFRKSRLH